MKKISSCKVNAEYNIYVVSVKLFCVVVCTFFACYRHRMKRESTSQIVSSKEIGARIRSRRREMGLSQEQLAELLDVTYQQVQRYENGSNRLSVERIQQIAAAMVVPLDYFFGSTSTETCADGSAKYLAGDESLLLTTFRRITNPGDRQTVLSVARMAASKACDGSADSLQLT